LCWLVFQRCNVNNGFFKALSCCDVSCLALPLLQPLHRELLAAESRARHTVQQFSTNFMPSGAASRSLRLNPRLLGRLTGNVWVEDSGGNRVDIGLAVKNAKQGLCVPGAQQ
jgi:hypothetical protein